MRSILHENKYDIIYEQNTKPRRNKAYYIIDQSNSFEQ